MNLNYDFKTKPYEHQLKAFLDARERNGYALFFEQGTGKTKAELDIVCYLYQNGALDGLVVFAPSGVHRDWVFDALPDHCPEFANAKGFAFNTKKAKQVGHRKEFDKLLKHDGLAVFTITYSAVTTAMGKKYLNDFIMQRKCAAAVDESTNIKNPTAKRTKAILKSAKFFVYRTIMDGTPITQGAFDIYAPLKFVDPDIWKDRGMSTYGAFKHRYGVFRKQKAAAGHSFEVLVKYVNIDELEGIVDEYGMRVLKEDCLDLPPKVYTKRRFEMSDEQKREYKRLTEEVEATDALLLEQEPMLAIVKLLRMQQVTAGFIGYKDEETGDKIEHDIGDSNPRLDTLIEICEALPHAAIIWSKFTRNIDKICEALGDECVRYDGQVDEDTRAENKAKFKSGQAKFFVANPAAAATGLTLTEAKTVIYYDNSFKLGDRLQSEDRAHRIGQDQSVNYIDIVAEGTIDEHILQCLRDKKSIADQITGDRIKKWI